MLHARVHHDPVLRASGSHLPIECIELILGDVGIGAAGQNQDLCLHDTRLGGCGGGEQTFQRESARLILDFAFLDGTVCEAWAEQADGEEDGSLAHGGCQASA